MKRSVAALLVTHDSAAWIEPTLRSILAQRHAPDAIVVIDDASQDDTRSIIEQVAGDRARIELATSRNPDTTTRIAQNFQQGVRACVDHDVVILGDHDDIWHPARIGHQIEQFRLHPELAMLASDGRVVDAHGRPTGGTLRSHFPVPDDFNTLDGAGQMRYALKHSVATGGASAIRPQVFAESPIPVGWLHDRWWSLRATARQGFRIDTDRVLDYRVSDAQQVGLDPGRQQAGSLERLGHAASDAPRVLRRIRDLQALRADAAGPQIAAILTPLGLLAALR